MLNISNHILINMIKKLVKCGKYICEKIKCFLKCKSECIFKNTE